MPPVDERYPALVERALKLIEERGGTVQAADLCRELFGAAGGPWPTLLARVLASDARLTCRDDGRWTVAANRPIDLVDRRVAPPATPRPLGEGRVTASPDARVTQRPPSAEDHTPPAAPPVGLVVLAAGPKPWRDPILALGAARLRPDGAVERWESLVRPPGEERRPVRVPRYLADYGVLVAELEEAPPLARALDDLLAFVGDSPLAGLDVGMAVARLQYALRELGRAPIDNPLLELSVAGDAKPDLVRLARAASLQVPNRLSPAALAGLAARLAAVPRDKGSDASALDATAWRRLLDPTVLWSVPEAPGVYRFLAADGRLLYVGKATSLRNRLASYLRGSFPLIRQMPGLIDATHRLEWEELPCELAARLREAELIAADAPPYNVQRRAGPPLVRARLALTGDPDPTGRVVPRLALAPVGACPEDAGGPGDAAPGEADERHVLTTAAAASEALRRARAGWWPPRPRANERPAPPAVLARFEQIAEAAAAEMSRVEVAPGLHASALDALLVVAPPRPHRTVGAADEEIDVDGWTRERRDAAWPPRELAPFWTDEPLDDVGDAAIDLAPADRSVEASAPAPSLVALLVTPAGLCASAVLPHAEGEPADAAEGLTDDALRVRAIEALAVAPRREPAAGGLAALSTLLAALRRGEADVLAWPLTQPREGASPSPTLAEAETRCALTLAEAETRRAPTPASVSAAPSDTAALPGQLHAPRRAT